MSAVHTVKPLFRYSVDRRHKHTGLLEGASEWFDTIEEAESRLEEILRRFLLQHRHWEEKFVYEIGFART